LSPTRPQNDAGIRIDPPPSAPSAIGQSPEATAAAEPLEEPPVARAGSYGFRAAPWCGLSPVTPIPISCMFALPISRAPALRSRATVEASSAHGVVPRKLVPTVVG